MKIEAGKFYRTQSGHKAKIYETGVKTLQSQETIVGAIFIGDRWKILTWNSCGVAGVSSYNIVGEWVEKPKINLNKLRELYKWAAMDKSGDWHLFPEKPEINHNDTGWFIYDGDFYVPPEIFEFSGDWKNSLIEL